MIRRLQIFTVFTFVLVPAFSQSSAVIDSLLSGLYTAGNSEYLATQKEAKAIASYGKKVLPILAEKFLDTTVTQVKSSCHNKYLNKGEVAIIIADRIEMMPYAALTGVENCILQFCDANPNLVEYYLGAIKRMIE